jgi:glycosyltransferase involved in cell wall biosynthesis
MITVGITMVRDEADIIGTVVEHMLTQVDVVIVADNRSVDGTSEIVNKGDVVYVVDNEVGYEQSKKMTALAHLAHGDFGADWIVPFDADEIWYAPNGHIGRYLDTVPADIHVVPANLYDHVCSGRDDPAEPDPVKRIQWRRDYAAPLPKVACRYREDMVIGMGNHDVIYGDKMAPGRERLAIRHFPYRSVDQIIRKVRNGAEAYAATDLPEHFGAHWRQWGQILDQQGPDAIGELFQKWYYREAPDQALIIEREVQNPLRFDPATDVMSTAPTP